VNDSSAATGLQYLSHASLIQHVTSPVRSTARLDAIIVPAARPAKNLTTAISLAQAADCHLIVLCSRRARPEEVQTLFAAKNFSRGTAVELPARYSHDLLKFGTSEWAKTDVGKLACGERDSDLSAKRNIGLLLARLRGWRRIFFMDDDIRGISASDLDRTVSLLGADGAGHRSAGLRVKYFPDNSVVCHARRKAGQHQEVFVSGSILAVDTTASIAFFPDIYNEDWLFFYNDVAARRMATPGLLATQMKQISYNPFADRNRAAREEFGDVIAEGLYSLLHSGLRWQAATSGYWLRFIDQRMRILDEIIDHADTSKGHIWAQIADSAVSARKTLTDIQPGMCAAYIETWQQDLRDWSRRLTELRPVGTVKEALLQLGL
jgi:hypothetical protein